MDRFGRKTMTEAPSPSKSLLCVSCDKVYDPPLSHRLPISQLSLSSDKVCTRNTVAQVCLCSWPERRMKGTCGSSSYSPSVPFYSESLCNESLITLFHSYLMSIRPLCSSLKASQFAAIKRHIRTRDTHGV